MVPQIDHKILLCFTIFEIAGESTRSAGLCLLGSAF